jgi:hypothetical protein
MRCDGLEMFVTLRGRRFTCKGCDPWRNNYRRFRLALGNSVIDDLAIGSRLLSTCPRRLAARIAEPCGIHLPDLSDVFGPKTAVL